MDAPTRDTRTNNAQDNDLNANSHTVVGTQKRRRYGATTSARPQVSSSAPVKRRKSSALWSMVEGLDVKDGKYTHKCGVCHEKLRLYKNKAGVYVPTNITRHFQQKHRATWHSATSSSRQKSESIQALFQRQTKKISDNEVNEKVAQAKQAILNFYLYCSQLISKRTIEGTAFREMIKAVTAVPASRAARLDVGRKGLVSGVQKEYDLWKRHFKRFVEASLLVSRGNPFAQGIHDCVTLKTGSKYIAVGMSCADPSAENNYTIALGFVPVSSSKAQVVSETLDKLCLDLCGHHYAELCHSTMSDFAAMNVAAEFTHEREGCAMHSNDKIARYAFGDLNRSRKKEIVERFRDGEQLMKKAQRCAVYFSYSTSRRRLRLKCIGACIEGETPDVVPKTDLSTTRVAARYKMVHSLLTLNRPIRKYAQESDDVDWEFTDDEWTALAEMEAVVKVSTEVTTMVQTETSQMGAMAYVLHNRLVQQLRSDSFPVLDLGKIAKSNPSPRFAKKVSDFSNVGRMCLQRACLEAERRLCGNLALTVEGINGAPVLPSHRDKLCLLLDPRTHHKIVGNNWDMADKLDAQNSLRNLFVDFFLNAERKHVELELTCNGHNDDEDDDDDDEDALLIVPKPRMSDVQQQTIEEWEKRRQSELKKKFNRDLKEYSSWLHRIKWHEYGRRPDAGGVDIPANYDEIDPFAHLLAVNIWPLLKTMPQSLSDLKLLMTHSKASLASVPAASYAERINSAGGIVSNKSNYQLDPKEVSMRVPLRMNRAFFGMLLNKFPEPVDVEVAQV